MHFWIESGYEGRLVVRYSPTLPQVQAEVVEGMKLSAKTEGIPAKTAGGAVIAGPRKLMTSGTIKRNELAVAFITGAGPKTQEIMAHGVHPLVVQPTLESFEEVFGKPL